VKLSDVVVRAGLILAWLGIAVAAPAALLAFVAGLVLLLIHTTP